MSKKKWYLHTNYIEQKSSLVSYTGYVVLALGDQERWVFHSRHMARRFSKERTGGRVVKVAVSEIKRKGKR